MDEMAAQGKLTELRELAVMKIDDRERLIQALGVVYGTGGRRIPRLRFDQRGLRALNRHS